MSGWWIESDALDQAAGVAMANTHAAHGAIVRFKISTAADFATDATTTIEDLATALGLHACTETYGSAAFDITGSAWVVNSHRQISIIPQRLCATGHDCRP